MSVLSPAFIARLINCHDYRVFPADIDEAGTEIPPTPCSPLLLEMRSLFSGGRAILEHQLSSLDSGQIRFRTTGSSSYRASQALGKAVYPQDPMQSSQ